MVVTVATAIAGAVVLGAIAVAVGLLLTRELLHGVIGRWDADVTAWLVARRTPARDDLSVIGSALAQSATVVVVIAVALGLLAWKRHWREFGIVAIAIAVEGVTYATATYVVTRHRPRVPRLEDLVVADSYFSGHVAAAVATYGSLAVVVWALTRRRWVRATVVVLAVLLPSIVALSRMYRGMHYASDAVVGALVGLGCIVVALVAVSVGARASTAVEPAPAGGPDDSRRDPRPSQPERRDDHGGGDRARGQAARRRARRAPRRAARARRHGSDVVPGAEEQACPGAGAPRRGGRRRPAVRVGR